MSVFIDPGPDGVPGPSLEERLARIERAIETLAWWLVQANTGFGQRDARGIVEILRGERE